MRVSTRTRRAVVGALLGTLLAVAAAGTAQAAPARKPTATPSATGTPVTTIPFSGTGSVDGTGTGTPGDPARNAAVAAACNDGTEIGAPQWYRLPALHGQKVLAAVDAPYTDTGRGHSHNPSGVAFVDSSTGAVLSCGETPLTLSRLRAVSVVAFYRFAIPACDWAEEDCYWQDGDLRLLVSPTSGAAPVNDLQAGATAITALPYSGAADTSLADDDGAAADFIDIDHCLLSAIDPTLQSTVWWRWTAPTSGLMPSLGVDLGTTWPATSRTPQVVAGLVGSEGITPVPRQDPDPWNCDSPQVVEAGRTYLIGVAVYHDAYYDATLQQGAPVTLRVGDVAVPGSPTQVAASASRNGRAHLSWQPPLASGTSAVDGYRVVLERRAASGPWETVSSVRLPASARELALRGLGGKDAFRLRVRALNSSGAGTPVDTLLSTGG